MKNSSCFCNVKLGDTLINMFSTKCMVIGLTNIIHEYRHIEAVDNTGSHHVVRPSDIDRGYIVKIIKAK